MPPSRVIEEARNLARNLGTRLPKIQAPCMGAYADHKLLHRHLQGSQASILCKLFTQDRKHLWS